MKKKVIKVSSYLYEGTTYLSVLYKDETSKTQFLETDGSEEVFGIITHLEVGHEFDFETDEDENITSFENYSLGISYEAKEEEEQTETPQKRPVYVESQRAGGIHLDWHFWVMLIAFIVIIGLLFTDVLK